MIKGLSQNIVCDECRGIITHQEYVVIKGKKRTLHYHKNGRCEHAYEMIKYNNTVRDRQRPKKTLFGAIVFFILSVAFYIYYIPFTIITMIILNSRWIYVEVFNISEVEEKAWQKDFALFANRLINRVIISTFVYLIIYLTR